MTEANASHINTHYYKLGRVNKIKYTVYGSSTNNDQSLLELELSIRYHNPNILITYYSKSLYYFEFDYDQNENLLDSYAELSFKYSNTVTVDKFANPPKNSNNDNYLAFASLGFLKALKKLILFNLSRNRVIEIFGNYCVLGSDQRNHILYLDPVLLTTGDILVSALIKPQLVLYNSSIIESSNNDLDFVIYLIPSGIRCHFFDSKLLSNNFIQQKVSNEKLVESLKYSIGYQLSDNITWVKLVPNLKHLNNQTSSISKFIHEVDNKKFILWPWNLCLLQFGHFQEIKEPITTIHSALNPLNLISDFIDFNITNSQLHHQNQHSVIPNSLSIPSVNSTGPSFSGLMHFDRMKETPSMNINEIAAPDSDLFNIPNSVDFFKEDINPKLDELSSNNVNTNENDDDMEIDELFGDDGDMVDDGDIGDIDKASDNPSQTKSISDVNNTSDLKTIDLQSSVKVNKDEPTIEFNDKKCPPDVTSTFIEIPKDQMTIKKQVSPTYNDPGAPLPIMPTPIFTQSAPASSVNPPIPVNEDTNKSVFSPILFNPIIKSNIDTKYGKGGKFYVEKELSSDIELEKRKNLRATSVSGIEIPLKEVDKDKQEINSNSSDESDEDEEFNTITNSSPLKLNMMNDPFMNKGFNFGGVPFAEKQDFNPVSINTDTISPLPIKTQNLNQPPKPESPFFIDEASNSLSPSDYDGQFKIQGQGISLTSLSIPKSRVDSDIEVEKSLGNEKEESLKISNESSNYLPLILRSINVNTIPNYYLMNNLINSNSIPNLSINEDYVDFDNDFDSSKNNGMIIKLNNINEFLSFLSPNLIFDLGLNTFKDKIQSQFHEKEFLIEYEKCNDNLEKSLLRIFPRSYKVNLIEFLKDASDYDSELDSQLNFLNEITNTEDILTPKVIFNKLKYIEWNSFNDGTSNTENFQSYKGLIDKLKDQIIPDNETFFKIPTVKVRVNKNNNIINLNSMGIKFWNYLNFGPINNQKNMQVLMISENHQYFNHDFLNNLIYNYKDANLGEISKVDLRSESDSELYISNGLLLINKESGHEYNEFYKQVNYKLNSLAELIKLDLINKTNRFEFDRPLLLLFVNFNEKLNSMLHISKIFKNFKNTLDNHQLPLVKIFTKIIPGNFLVKQLSNEVSPKFLSNAKLTRISMNLYNQCSNDLISKEVTTNIFTQIVKEPPTKIQFKFPNINSKDNNSINSLNDDIFLHLAYERSVDRNWMAAAWSDPVGVVTYTKTWFCSPVFASKNKGIFDLSAITNEIWSISTKLFEKLNDQIINKASGLGGKKFLVLTRINSIIPDDELIHWKRLSVKHKDISLIVLSVNKSPKLIFEKEKDLISSKVTDEDNQSCLDSGVNNTGNKNTNNSHFKNFNTSTNSSPAGTSMAPSYSPNGISLHSPQQLFNVSGMFLTPQDFIPSVTGNGSNLPGMAPEAYLTIDEKNSDVFGVIPKRPLPSFNSPTRLGMKIGYLLKSHKDDYLVFEVNLLSCSNFWDLNVIMKLLLQQYKKLIILNDILGLRDIDGDIDTNSESLRNKKENYYIEGVVPWHILAVSKVLEYLVHVHIEE